MKTKKIYNAPKLEIVDIDSTPILAGSDPNGSTIPGGTTVQVILVVQLLSQLSVPQSTLILGYQKKSNPLIHYYIFGLRSIGCKPFFSST